MLLVNGGQSTLASSITNSGTTISVATGDGGKFPTGDFTITIDDGTHQEVVYVPSGGRSGDTFSGCVRAYEPYAGAATAWAFTAGTNTLIAQTVTASTLNRLVGNGSKLLLDWSASQASDLMAVTSLTAATWTDVTGTSQSFTIDDATAAIEVRVSGSLSGDMGSAGGMKARVVIDNDTTNYAIENAGLFFGGANYANYLSGVEPINFFGLGIGSHTVKLQVWEQQATGRVWVRGLTDKTPLSIRVWQIPRATTTLSPVVANGAKVLLDYQQATNLADVTTVNGSWVDSGVTHTFTVDDPNALIDIEINGNVLDSQSGAHGIGSRVLVDGTIAKPLGGTYGSYGNFLAGAGTITIGPLSVGVHTAKVQYGCDLGGTAQCRASTRAVNGESYSARIIQRPQVQSTPVGGTAGDKLLLNYVEASDIANAAATTGAAWNNLGSSKAFVVDDPSASIEILASGCALVGQGGAELTVGLSVLIDGTARYRLGGARTIASGFGNVFSGAGPVAISGLATGSHTVQVQFYPEATGVWYLVPATAPNLYAFQLRIWQRPTIYRGASVPSAKFTLATNQSIANTTWTTCPFDARSYDTDNITDIVTNKGRATIRTPGKYLLTGIVTCGTNSNGSRQARILKNGATVLNNGNPNDVANTGDSVRTVLTVGDLSVGDYVELQMYQAAGGGLQFWAGQNEFTITRIGDAAFGGPIKFAEVVLTGTQASVTLPVSGSLPQNYRNIRITYQTRTDGANTYQQMRVRFNGDAGANYDWGSWDQTGAFAGAGDNQMTLEYVPGGAAAANYPGQGIIQINNYSGTTFYKTLTNYSDQQGGLNRPMLSGGTWKSTAAITSVTLLLDANNFVAGSIFTLYLEP